jgi:hypothetical protein
VLELLGWAANRREGTSTRLVLGSGKPQKSLKDQLVRSLIAINAPFRLTSMKPRRSARSPGGPHTAGG